MLANFAICNESLLMDFVFRVTGERGGIVFLSFFERAGKDEQQMNKAFRFGSDDLLYKGSQAWDRPSN